MRHKAPRSAKFVVFMRVIVFYDVLKLKIRFPFKRAAKRRFAPKSFAQP